MYVLPSLFTPLDPSLLFISSPSISPSYTLFASLVCVCEILREWYRRRDDGSGFVSKMAGDRSMQMGWGRGCPGLLRRKAGRGGAQCTRWEGELGNWRGGALLVGVELKKGCIVFPRLLCIVYTYQLTCMYAQSWFSYLIYMCMHHNTCICMYVYFGVL